MPSVIENVHYWNGKYNWHRKGEEWSDPWGNSETEWLTTVYPRIREFLPVDTALEIGPGFGRWTKFLIPHVKSLFVVDISPRCVAALQERFSAIDCVKCLLNDGMSLEMINSNILDFVFSFDSLVHADLLVLEHYLHQLHYRLKPGATGFIHHSNLGAYVHRLPQQTVPELELWRSRDVDAGVFRRLCERAGLWCVKQELVNWCNCGILLDCFSTVVNTPTVTPTSTVIKNWTFMREARSKGNDSIKSVLNQRPEEISRDEH
jgi:hypothetical protein